jgi:hypothetical protein
MAVFILGGVRIHSNRTEVGTCSYIDIFELEWAPYLLIWAAIKKKLHGKERSTMYKRVSEVSCFPAIWRLHIIFGASLPGRFPG